MKRLKRCDMCGADMIISPVGVNLAELSEAEKFFARGRNYVYFCERCNFSESYGKEKNVLNTRWGKPI